MIASSRNIPPVTWYVGSIPGLRCSACEKSPLEGEVLGIDGQYAPSSSKSVIRATKIHMPNMKLSQSRGTHYAGLYRDVQVGLLENRSRISLQNLIDGNELSMACTLFLVIFAIWSQREIASTFKVRLVSFMPLPMTWSSCTKTQPTGTSSDSSAFSAYEADETK